MSRTTNRCTTETTYDEAGQVVADNKFRGMGFGYDANGRTVKVTEVNQPDALSVYDAAGMRVAECVNNVWKFSIYDIGGKMIAEYGGQQSTDEGGVKYLLSDWQGSTRAILSNSGLVNARLDYTAFGEEINSGVGLRTAAQGFGSNNTLNQKYALTERDTATGFDHTWFRKNESQAGRWTGPDPYGGSMLIADPQSFNRYSYVQNQPNNFVDPSGLLMADCRWVWRVPVTCVNGDCVPDYDHAGWVLQCTIIPGGGGIDTGRRPPPPTDEGTGPLVQPFRSSFPPIRGVERPMPDPPTEDPCGNGTDIGASVGIFNAGIQIGKHALYGYLGLGGGLPRLGSASMSAPNSSPKEGIFVSGSAGVFIGISRSVEANGVQDIPSAFGRFFSRSSGASHAGGAMTPQLSLQVQKNVRIYNFRAASADCLK